MNYRKIEKDNYTLHLLETKKFKKIDIALYLSDNNKDLETYRTLLSHVLITSSKKYNSKRKLASIYEEYYNSSYNFTHERLANVYLSKFNASYYEERFLKEDLEEKIIELLYELVYCPNVIDDAFEEKNFKIAKDSMREILKLSKENNIEVASDEFLNVFSPKTALANNPLGKIEELEKINAKDLYKYYQKFISSAKTDIYVIGNICEEKTASLIEKHFSKIVSNKLSEAEFTKHEKEDIKELTSFKNALQNISIVGYKLDGLNKYQSQIVLNLYNDIYGGGATSRLFNTVREERSLCYAIRSRASFSDNFLTVTTSYSKENYEQVISLIKDIQLAIFDNVTKEELANAKATLLSHVKKINNNSSALIEAKYLEDYLAMFSLEEYEEKVKSVTLQDIKDLKKHINLDTIYTLGGTNEEDN